MVEVGPGGTIRFAVGSPDGERSATWRLWSSRNSAYVYLAGRSIAGIEKISFHASGSWSRSFVNDEAAAPFVSQGDSRHWEIWQRPDQFAPGWTKAYALEVPHTDLRTWPQHPSERGEVAFAPAPGPGHWVTIHILLADADCTTTLDMGDIRVIGKMTPL